MKFVLNCVIYLSEARNRDILQNCLHLCKAESYPLIHWFDDSVYNRSSFYFATEIDQGELDSFNGRVDFKKHSGLHPTLGTIDHISFSPLLSTSNTDRSSDTHQALRSHAFQSSANIAADFTRQFYTQFQLPVYTYGHLSDPQLIPSIKRFIRLKEIRKSLGYFRPPALFSHETLQQLISENSEGITPTFGAAEDYSPSTGITSIGCVPLIQNYNVRIQPSSRFFDNGGSADQVLTIAKQLTKAIRTSQVEAIALPYETEVTAKESHPHCIEIACNILDPEVVTPDRVYGQLDQLLKPHQLEIVTAYTTNPTVNQLLEQYLRLQL